MGSLGCQAQRSTPEAIAFAARSPIVKGVNNVDILTKAPDSAIRIFRWVFDNQNLSDPAGAFGAILGRLQGYRHPNLYVETYNELPKEARTQYIDFLKAVVPMLHAAGLKVAGPSWATGDYDQEDWDAFREAGWVGLDAIALHAYWANAGFSPWNALRWRTYYSGSLDRGLGVFVTECGRDRIRDGSGGTYIGRGGWVSDGLSASAYAAEVNAYGAQLLPHEYALPFVSGPESNWLNYSVDPVSALLTVSATPIQQGGNVPDFTSPNHDGPRAQTLGVVIHATLGGSASPETEYQSTINWFESTASEVSAHAVAGPGGKVHRSVRPGDTAWHCRASNATHLGIELAKAHVGDVILPEILDAAAQVVAGWCHDYNIPVVWSTTHGLAEHREMPTNTDGHQDVGGPFDRADFLARVKKYATEDQLTDQQKKDVLSAFDFIWAYSKADQIKKNPAEAEKVIHERLVSAKVILGING